MKTTKVPIDPVTVEIEVVKFGEHLFTFIGRLLRGGGHKRIMNVVTLRVTQIQGNGKSGQSEEVCLLAGDSLRVSADRKITFS